MKSPGSRRFTPPRWLDRLVLILLLLLVVGLLASLVIIMLSLSGLTPS